MSRREKGEIIKEILELCISPVGITKIVYGCNLNFKVVKKYMNWCFINGWLIRELIGRNKIYTTTDLGINQINIFAQTINLTQF